jgi:hypothetical protein
VNPVRLKTNFLNVGFQVPKAVTKKRMVLWILTACLTTESDVSWKISPQSSGSKCKPGNEPAKVGDRIYLSIYLSIYIWLYSPLLDLGRFFRFFNFYIVSTTSWAGDQPVARPLPTHTGQHKDRINSHKHPCLEWDSNPWSSAFQGAKTVHALECAATVIGRRQVQLTKISRPEFAACLYYQSMFSLYVRW